LSVEKAFAEHGERTIACIVERVALLAHFECTKQIPVVLELLFAVLFKIGKVVDRTLGTFKSHVLAEHFECIKRCLDAQVETYHLV
jgi:hypothetical protein